MSRSPIIIALLFAFISTAHAGNANFRRAEKFAKSLLPELVARGLVRGPNTPRFEDKGHFEDAANGLKATVSHGRILVISDNRDGSTTRRRFEYLSTRLKCVESHRSTKN